MRWINSKIILANNLHTLPLIIICLYQMRVVRMQKSCKIFVDEIYFHKFTTTRFNWAIYHQIKDSLYFQIAVLILFISKFIKNFPMNCQILFKNNFLNPLSGQPIIVWMVMNCELGIIAIQEKWLSFHNNFCNTCHKCCL